MKYTIFLVPLAMALVVGSYNPQTSFAGTPGASLQQAHAASNIKNTAELVPPEINDLITLDFAIDAAIKHHPSLAASLHGIKASQGAAQQAGLRPNPVLFGEIEEFGGSGDFSGTGVMSSRLGISQEFLLGEKISKRVREAEVDVSIAALEHKINIVEFMATVEKRFYEVYALQVQSELQAEQLELIQKTHNVVAKRVKVGDTSPLDLARSQVELASAKIETELIRQELESARYALAESWGARSPFFSAVSAQYKPNLDFTEHGLKNALEQSPGWQLLEIQSSRAHAALALARAQNIPDIEFEGGIQRFNESDNHAFFLGVSIPLPLFDRNQGGIIEAKASARKAEHEREAGYLTLNKEFQEAWRKLLSTRQAVQSLDAEVIPAARNSYESINIAYKAGEVAILDLLDAQRTWVDIRKTRLGLLHDLENSRIEIERLIGGKAALTT